MNAADASPSKPLNGRLAVLTGATGALGRHLAAAIVEDGASLVACHHRDLSSGAEAWLNALCHRAALTGQRVEIVQADLCRAEGIAHAFAVAARLGGCDLLVNSASVLLRQRFEEANFEQMADLVALNVTSPMACCQTAIAQMRGRSRGDIVNIIDVGGLIAWKRGAAYCATRAAIAMLTRCLSLEFAPMIRVNALAPGLIDLPGEEALDKAFDRALRNIPMARPAKVAEVVAAFRFLIAGPSAMSGQILAVDGGRSARGS